MDGVICSVCNTQFPSEKSLAYHHRRAHKAVQWETNPPPDVAVFVDKLVAVFVDNLAVSYDCTVCGMQIPTRARLKRHMGTHSDERAFACTHPGCTKRFRRADTRNMHMRVHDAVEAEFVCCKCDRAYQHLRSLLLHQRKKTCRRGRRFTACS
jgi:uncharacterized Zn-finger protein